jgi:hypothetical protein
MLNINLEIVNYSYMKNSKTLDCITGQIEQATNYNVF